ncbi:MAG: SLC13 family permease [Eubacteriales bacterium]|nr:SLC13 family permease [Eubacteriales bacterium]
MNILTITALIIFFVTYVLMFTMQKFRPYIALASAAVFVLIGSIGIFPEFSYTVPDALREIDWNVLMMIAGTMGTVYYFIESKMPNLMADMLVSKVHTVKIMVLSLSLFAGIISAFVDNVATVLMIAPVALAICRKLKISPVPTIICIAVSSNLQGAATLVGDTTSILLAKAANLDFMGFFWCEGRPGMFFVTEIGALASALIILYKFRNDNQKIDVNDRTKVEDYFPAIMLLLTVVTLIVVSFIPYKDSAAPGQFYKPDITNGLICMTFFLITMIRDVLVNKRMDSVKGVLKEMDYYTLSLLLGLFIVIGGITRAGVIDLIGATLAKLGSGGSKMAVFIVYTVIVWISVLLSAFIDNIPYTATMLPVVAVLASELSAHSGLTINPNLFYFGLLVGATLGGNLTPIGASANITGLGILRKEGHEVSSGEFMKYGVPFTLAAVITGYVLVWILWS